MEKGKDVLIQKVNEFNREKGIITERKKKVLKKFVVDKDNASQYKKRILQSFYLL